MADTRLPTEARTAKDGIHHEAYREILQGNGITMLGAYNEPPQHVQALLVDVLPAEPVTITGYIETVDQREMAIRGADENGVKFFITSLIRARIDVSRLQMGWKRNLLDPLRVPNRLGQPRIVTPNPDLYLGYSLEQFSDDLESLLGDFDSNHAKFAFLEVEIKGDDETGSGGLWVATNQCMGAASTFLNILNKLQSALRENNLVDEANALEPVIFSIATNGTEARLYATYSKCEGEFTTHFVKGFLLYDASSRATLDAYIQHIADWGTNKRLDTIQSALRALWEAGVRPIQPSPTISGVEENCDPETSESSQFYLEMSDSSIDRPHAGRGVEPEPRQAGSKKRAADSQPSASKRRKATGVQGRSK